MNKQRDDELPDDALVRSPSDFMLTLLLEDFLGEEVPPDLKSRLLASLETTVSGNGLPTQVGLANARCSTADYDEAIRAASEDLKNGYGTSIPALLETPDLASRSADGTMVWIRRGVYLALALAAAVMGTIFAPSALKSRTTAEIRTDIAKSSQAIDTKSIDTKSIDTKSIDTQAIDTKSPDAIVAIDQSNNGPTNDRPNNVNEGVAATTPKTNEETIDEQGKPPVHGLLESVASRSNKPKGQNAEPIVSNMPAASVVSKAMSDAEIVSVIDSQLSFLWDRVGLTAAASVQIDVWLDRAASAILGRQATSAEKEAFRLSKGENRVANYVDHLVSSSEFSRYWSTRLAEHYLGKRLPTTRDLSVSEYAFVEWLDESLSEKVFIGETERTMISGPVVDRSIGSRVRTDPASYWIAETMERTATNHGESVDQLVPPAKRRQPQQESLIGVSRQLMRISGNPSMVCSQCHTDETGGSDLRGYISMSKTQVAAGSNSFWSVPASLSGLTLLHQTFERTLRTEPPADFFFEDGEGRMKLAIAGPPSLQKIQNGNKPLDEWLDSSAEPRRAIVEMVWGQIFKQPLVPVMGLSEEEGLNERVDLRELLASQMQLRKADLGSLVRWIVFSKSFRIEGFKTDAPWYLKSTESQIAESQRKMRMFAGFAATESLIAESGKLSLGRVASWIDQKRSFQKANDATLAQGTSGKPSGKGPKTLKLDYSEDQVRYLVSIEEPYSQLKALSERWAKSPMSWQMLLEHVYLATDARFPTRLERDDANKLFESSGKDRAKTLVMIVTARLGSW